MVYCPFAAIPNDKTLSGGLGRRSRGSYWYQNKCASFAQRRCLIGNIATSTEDHAMTTTEFTESRQTLVVGPTGELTQEEDLPGLSRTVVDQIHQENLIPDLVAP